MAPRKAIKEPAPAIAPLSDDVTIEAKLLGMPRQAPPFELKPQALFKSMPQPKSEEKAPKDAISFDYKPMDDKRLYLDNDKRLYLDKDQRFFVEVNPKTLSVSVGCKLSF